MIQRRGSLRTRPLFGLLDGIKRRFNLNHRLIRSTARWLAEQSTMFGQRTMVVVLGVLTSILPAFAEGPAELRAVDIPSDDGSAVGLIWKRSTDEKITAYQVYVGFGADGQPPARDQFKMIAEVAPTASLLSDAPRYFGHWPSLKEDHLVKVSLAELRQPQIQALLNERVADRLKEKGLDPASTIAKVYADRHRANIEASVRQEVLAQPAYFSVVTVKEGQRTASDPIEAAARSNWFKWFRLNNLLVLVGFAAAMLMCLSTARKREVNLRKIAGLEALNEALGRATEMGKPVFFVHGLREVNKLSTIAAISILGGVARRVAQFDTDLRVMNYDTVVMAVSREVVREAYLEAGRPDAFRDEIVELPAVDQFPYVAAVGGRMVRDKPAAILFMGFFYAESLILAETGASTGAIQIVGTDSFTQLPFFIPTCDYTLIGEELYAASAYLSKDPVQLGSIKAQDFGKIAIASVLVVGIIVTWISPIFGSFGEYLELFPKAFGVH